MKTSSLSRLLSASVMILPVLVTTLRAEDAARLFADIVVAPALVATADIKAIAPAQAAAQAEPLKPQPDKVDLSALYYYASQHQDQRVKAEADRLRLKYPGFELPADLYQPQGVKVSEAPLWGLYEKDDYAGIDAAIADLKAKNPGWSPSADFTAKLARRKLRVTLTKAYQAKDWPGVISAANGLDPRHETEVDLLWMLVDACHEANMKDGAAEVYKGILFRPKDARLPDAVLITTLQKAMRDFDPAEIKSAMANLWPNPQLVQGLKQVTDDFIRLDIADFNKRSERQEPIGEQDIQRIRDLVAARADVNDMSLLGWYFLKLKQPKEAEPLFARALEARPSPEFAKGLYLSIAQQGRNDEAFAVATANLTEFSEDPGFLMNALSLRFAEPQLGAVDAKTVEAYSATILKTKSADHAETLAWYAYNTRQFKASEAWFAQAWNWEEQPTRLKGLALSYQREGKRKEFKALQQQFGDLYPEMWAEIARPQPAPRAEVQAVAVVTPASFSDATTDNRDEGRASSRKPVGGGYAAALKAKRYGDCISEIDVMGAIGRVSPDADLIRGWCHLSLNHVSDARFAFAAALSGKGKVRSDAAYGGALAALRVKLTDEAEAIVSAYPLPADKDREIRAEINWQRARSAFDHKDYQATLDALNARLQLVPENADISALRAWAHDKLGHKAEAKAILEKLNSQISDPAVTRGLAQLND